MIVAASIVLVCDSATRAKLNTSRSRQPGTSFWQDALMDWHTAKPWVFALQLLEWSLQLAAYYTSVLLGKVGIGFIAAGYGRLSTLFPTAAITSLGCFAFWLSLILSDAKRSERGPFITFLMLDGLSASAIVCLSLASRIELASPAHFAGFKWSLRRQRGRNPLETPTADLFKRSPGAGQMPDSC